MQRYRQNVDELIATLSPIEASWKDEHAETVTSVIASIPEKSAYCRADIVPILEHDFDAGLTAIRLILDMSKDELGIAVRVVSVSRDSTRIYTRMSTHSNSLALSLRCRT